MSETTIQERLRAMAEAATGRSETVRLGEIFDDVQAALNAGVSRKSVLSALHQDGFTMTLASFDSALARLRKRRAAESRDGPSSSESVPMPLGNSIQAVDKNSVPLVASKASHLPENWRTGRLTPAQAQLLTSEQQRERRLARDTLYHPTPYDNLTKGKT